jgi:hypothetical protein
MHYSRWQAHGDPLVKLKAHTRQVPGQICSRPGCAAPSKARGLCKAHYNEAWVNDRPACSLAGCDRPARTGGMCSAHYQRLRKYGHPLAGPAFRRQRGTGLPRWVYQNLRDEDRAQMDADAIAMVEILHCDPCAYCGTPSEHIDHITPFSAGGRLTADNVTAACAGCNHRKLNTTLLHFMLAEVA